MFPPLASDQFDAYKAAHLLWRAGFGCTWPEAERVAKLGLAAAVEELVNFSPSPPAEPPPFLSLKESEADFQARLKELSELERNKLRGEREQAEREKIGELKFWWLNRMLASAVGGAVPPLQEKMTLFWHSHFASSFHDKIERSFPMWQQNELFRRHALAAFPEIMRAVIRDPAMLVWLDNAGSHRGRPNENFARELMELFSLGVGNYTEHDVKEGARALTGFGVQREDWSFRFDANAHDNESKSYLGETGDWSGDDVVRIICQQEACAKFMARKLLEFFVINNPGPEMIAHAAANLREGKYELKPFLKMLFTSELFYSDRAMNSVVKSPVVLAIGALKAMGVAVPAKSVLTDALRLMGQDLFFPPDVNGWPGGMTWINSNMLLVRYNFANFLLNGVSPDQFKMFNRKSAGSGAKRRDFVEKQRDPNAIEWSPRAQLKALGIESKLITAGDIVDHYVRSFLQRPAAPSYRKPLLDFAETDAAGGHRTFSILDANFDERARGLVHLIMSSPDYQLC